jgi:hypothetical protein
MMGQVEGIQAITKCKVTAVLAELLQYCALTLSGSRAYTLQETDFVRRRTEPMANANKPWPKQTESKICQLRTTSEMFDQEESMSTIFKYRPLEGEGQFTESTKDKGPNIPCASTMPSESLSESFFLNGQTTVHSH